MIAIIGVLIGLLLPAVQAVRESARRTQCTSQLRQVAAAVLLHEAATTRYPPGRIGCDDAGDGPDPPVQCPPGLPPEKKTAASGFVPLLPYLELPALYEQLAVEVGGLWNRNVDDLNWYDDPAKCRGIKQRIAMLVCPDDSSEPISDVYLPVHAATATYAFVQGSLGPRATPNVAKYANDGLFFYVTALRPREATDGLSRTLALGETILSDTWESSNTWSYALVHADCLRSTEYPLNTRPGSGYAYERRNGAFASNHPHGAQFAFADGHVEFVDDAIDLPVYRSLSTAVGGETD